MTALVVHLDEADGEAVWWAESPDLPGFSAAAPTLAELRERVTGAIGDGWTEHLAGGPVRILTLPVTPQE